MVQCPVTPKPTWGKKRNRKQVAEGGRKRGAQEGTKAKLSPTMAGPRDPRDLGGWGVVVPEAASQLPVGCEAGGLLHCHV